MLLVFLTRWVQYSVQEISRVYGDSLLHIYQNETEFNGLKRTTIITFEILNLSVSFKFHVQAEQMQCKPNVMIYNTTDTYGQGWALIHSSHILNYIPEWQQVCIKTS